MKNISSNIQTILRSKIARNCEKLEDKISHLEYKTRLNSILWQELWREFDYAQIINP